MDKYKFEYKIAKDHELKSGEWITDLPASKICAWFETIGWEVLYLNRVCQCYLEVEQIPIPYKDTNIKVGYYRESIEV